MMGLNEASTMRPVTFLKIKAAGFTYEWHHRSFSSLDNCPIALDDVQLPYDPQPFRDAIISFFWLDLLVSTQN
ncbi:hypothetical protein JNB91_28585 [Rhizobium wenxiniae]|uniref:hypothetical protein n=1 Tax=Rhizobium wenxiniae TaxID=1737357 RepID=UPI001C6E4032|nr:hypothetical protein [Rhizobium wenxiniae]MBW9091744.1 hypothetical protein [Rhizobium wenxiniae]